jgi:hypothetical protein
MQAARLFAEGVAPVQVAARLRVSTKSAYQWRRRWRAGGEQALASTARGLRRRLRTEVPYIWSGPCNLCAQYFDDDRDWYQRAKADFPPH